jgi:LmbE family N-acetylglucosaminyl deacetylase
MKVLAIGAHFDDVEIGCGGALLKHRDRGDEIHLIVVTHSGYESETKQFVRSREQARREGESSARFLNANLICCEKEPLILTPTEQLVLELESLVNSIKPDRIYTHQSTDCHADHAAVGYVSTRACRKCDEVFLYRSNWYIMENSRDDNYYVDISKYIDKKADLISLYESEMVTVNYSWLDFVKKQNGAAGAKVNVSYAETFCVMKLFWK